MKAFLPGFVEPKRRGGLPCSLRRVPVFAFPERGRSPCTGGGGLVRDLIDVVGML